MRGQNEETAEHHGWDRLQRVQVHRVDDLHAFLIARYRGPLFGQLLDLVVSEETRPTFGAETAKHRADGGVDERRAKPPVMEDRPAALLDRIRLGASLRQGVPVHLL